MTTVGLAFVVKLPLHLCIAGALIGAITALLGDLEVRELRLKKRLDAGAVELEQARAALQACLG